MIFCVCVLLARVVCLLTCYVILCRSCAGDDGSGGVLDLLCVWCVGVLVCCCVVCVCVCVCVVHHFVQQDLAVLGEFDSASTAHQPVCLCVFVYVCVC